MGSCGTSTKQTHAVKPNNMSSPPMGHGAYQSGQQKNNNKANSYNAMNSNNFNPEAYYQEIGLSDNFGVDYGPKEKIQLNAGIRNGTPGAVYKVQINLSYDKTGANSTILGHTKEEVANQDGSLNFSLSFIL